MYDLKKIKLAQVVLKKKDIKKTTLNPRYPEVNKMGLDLREIDLVSFSLYCRSDSH